MAGSALPVSPVPRRCRCRCSSRRCRSVGVARRADVAVRRGGRDAVDRTDLEVRAGCHDQEAAAVDEGTRAHVERAATRDVKFERLPPMRLKIELPCSDETAAAVDRAQRAAVAAHNAEVPLPLAVRVPLTCLMRDAGERDAPRHASLPARIDSQVLRYCPPSEPCTFE